MKALSLWQPWATLIVTGKKKVETRSWKTNYTGRIAIHAARNFPKVAREFAETERALGRLPGQLPFGAIIGFATIKEMRRTEDVEQQVTALERLYGDYSTGRWAWMLTDAKMLNEPIPCVGRQGLFTVPDGYDCDEKGDPL